MEVKPWYLSKTLWLNILAIIALVVQNATGQDWINTDIQLAIITVANFILRLVTKQAIS